MSSNPKLPQRKLPRMKNYDYSKEGMYFLTLCTQHKVELFGHITDEVMILNDAGHMITRWWFELENKFKNVRCDVHVIMPNHFHGIIQILPPPPVGADLCVGPRPLADRHMFDPKRNALHGAPLPANQSQPDEPTAGRHIGRPLQVSIPTIVQWFKTMTSNEYIQGVKQYEWLPFNQKLWQRNYWEHIIRNEKTLHRIQMYIHDNPKNWQIDQLNSAAKDHLMESQPVYGYEPWMV